MNEDFYANNYKGLERSFQRIARWQRRFNHPGPEPALRHMVEEIQDELLGPGQDPRDLKELADLFILWVGAVDNSDHCLSAIIAAVDSKMDENVKRTWQAPDADGIIRHVKEAGA